MSHWLHYLMGGKTWRKLRPWTEGKLFFKIWVTCRQSMLNPLGREAGKDFRWESVCLLLCPAKFQDKILCCCCCRCFWKHSELTGSENMQLFAFCNLKSNASTVSDLLALRGFDKPGEYRIPDQFLGVGKFIDFFQWMCPRKRAAGRSQPALRAHQSWWEWNWMRMGLNTGLWEY